MIWLMLDISWKYYLYVYAYFAAYGTGKSSDSVYDSEDDDNDFNSYHELTNESQSFVQHSQHGNDVEIKMELHDDDMEDDIDWANDDTQMNGEEDEGVLWADGSNAGDAGDISSGYAEDTFSFTFINALLGLPRPLG